MTSAAAALARLHRAPPILVLPNAWDSASARVFEDAGFPAIATTSAGIAFARGYPDGEKIGLREMAEEVARIVRAVRVPVTADLEGGYGDVEAAVNAVIDAGAAGMNLEDAAHGRDEGLVPVGEQIDRIRRARKVADRRGIPLVLNARTDVFLRTTGPDPNAVPVAIERLNAYRDAGADCLFAPGVNDATRIRALVQAVKGPLNVLAGAGTPSAAELEALGVARLTVGSGAMRAAMGFTRRLAKQLRESGFSSLLTEQTIPYAEANRLMDRRGR